MSVCKGISYMSLDFLISNPTCYSNGVDPDWIRIQVALRILIQIQE
jgi:hypothetical protein